MSFVVFWIINIYIDQVDQHRRILDLDLVFLYLSVLL